VKSREHHAGEEAARPEFHQQARALPPDRKQRGGEDCHAEQAGQQAEQVGKRRHLGEKTAHRDATERDTDCSHRGTDERVASPPADDAEAEDGEPGEFEREPRHHHLLRLGQCEDDDDGDGHRSDAAQRGRPRVQFPRRVRLPRAHR